ncbi:MAG TPA: ABC transporter permease [Gemmataceae bacterium]|jgi:phospholipid/cholesterol/gamma-HCH transport system permease protein|nr:ABC transporter permease [Gemmataceae bacterium]
MSSANQETAGPFSSFGRAAYDAVAALGDLAAFGGRMLAWLVRRRPVRGTLLGSLYAVGVLSVPVVAVTGTFIGMVLAVQSYSQFHSIGLDTRLGALINVNIVRELGPVLAATMIAGRVGSAMAAELGTMRITEQVDALSCLGFNPVHYLVVPRFLACVLLIPLLSLLADFMGIMGGALICTRVYHVEAHYYWAHAQAYVGLWDVSSGLIKSVFFGGAIAVIGCHRGLNCRPGAEGVGRAATEAFVASFIAILVLDFFLAVFLNDLSVRLWPAAGAKLM